MKFEKEQIDEIQRQNSLLKKCGTGNGNSKEVLKCRSSNEVLTSRDDFQRDYARILYSSFFRRLQGKMQILGVESTAFFRNRLTHSLEVSQIACSIANVINKSLNNQIIYDNSDMYLLQAAALAHDIGHPAFGHKGERVLDALAKRFLLRFEGNAQNFRVLRLLEKKGPDFKGLNLTYRTLLAINKYIIEEDLHTKKFMYREDFEFLGNIRNQNGLKNIRTLDVQIIDLADEIAYAVHDLEDALSLRYFNIDELLYKLNIDDPQIYNIFNEDFVSKAREYAIKSESYKTIQEYSQVFRKRMTSLLTHEFIKDITLSEISEEDAKKHGTKEGNCELSLGKYKNLSEKLRTLIFECVTRDSDVALYERRGEIVLQSLYALYSDKSVNKNGMLFPPDYRPDKDDDKICARNTIDYLAGMMDTFAISEYEKYFGVKFDKIPINNKRDKCDKKIL
ncbi:deoxyguanosinetriphosphate triphosphohydrolase family protein [Porphyromonas gingivalis]|uniref:deoxyguanosinetriphosphate triphosphohydrolase family protein n=1 Tax=Porphyromonas gingivalis TaxID=837 RepID=UPI0003AD2471|nr:dNTP triphosphohydrolase [Porphyromonas gingivalis]ALO29422.1 deoxyguanosinetriphosphate triphosphohydrolase, putative [Porphyromonas gingivalis A7A1-28]ATR92714.1 deoxyguanosinetriphosphate triphosphohydrolase [Porphyromonas gingivalis]ATS09035.1 deoxyguanosinetriphosphate triphosphohydrolase [Porphyromonas gingivalis]ERJ70590.1 putative dGTPase [Porphyromonas gingivalis F0568]MCE8183143.1 dNTP triphosphohydrolase [Porphyromonas gingivalis]